MIYILTKVGTAVDGRTGEIVVQATGRRQLFEFLVTQPGSIRGVFRPQNRIQVLFANKATASAALADAVLLELTPAVPKPG